MGTLAKTDNKFFAPKLLVRRHFLAKYHPPGTAMRVLDCCQGDGQLWGFLRREFAVAEYLGLDVKPKKGRVKLASERYLALSGWPQTVIDVDTYGSPWKHWHAMLPNIVRPVTVFLTLGLVTPGGGSNLGAVTGSVMNFDNLASLPPSLAAKLAPHTVAYHLFAATRAGLRIVEAKEAVGGFSNARYLGLRIEPVK